MSARPALAVIGAGPRGTGLAERLAANAPALYGDRPLDLHLIDPHPPGSGRIWRREQSPLLWMYSMAEDVTMFTGWHVGVSTTGAEARLFGRRPAAPAPDLWHEAGECADVCARLWDSWEDDAEIRSTAAPRPTAGPRRAAGARRAHRRPRRRRDGARARAGERAAAGRPGHVLPGRPGRPRRPDHPVAPGRRGRRLPPHTDHTARDLERIVNGTVALLQHRSLFRTFYPGGTLREHLGLARPANRYARAGERV